MLSSIYIKNFAIIDEIEIDFFENMSVLTGETGAGKSILIDAINVVFGNKKTIIARGIKYNKFLNP